MLFLPSGWWTLTSDSKSCDIFWFLKKFVASFLELPLFYIHFCLVSVPLYFSYSFTCLCDLKYNSLIVCICISVMPRKHIKKKRHHFDDKVPYSQSYCFSSSHVQMWELDHKEGWELKNWCFQIVVLRMTLESPLDCKGIKPINSEGNQHWIFVGRGSLVAHLVKNLPPVQETWVWSLGWEDALEKEIATHSSILAWEIPWTEEPGRL